MTTIINKSQKEITVHIENIQFRLLPDTYVEKFKNDTYIIYKGSPLSM